MSMSLLIAGVGLLLWYLLDCYASPWADCLYCGGSPKKRDSVRWLPLALLGLIAWGGVSIGLPPGPVLLGAVALALVGASGKTFRFCAVPVWLGGCGGSGRRRRLGSLLLRAGVGKVD